MSNYCLRVIKEIKQSHPVDSVNKNKPLSHKQVRKLLKRERRRVKRTQAAAIRTVSDCEQEPASLTSSGTSKDHQESAKDTNSEPNGQEIERDSVPNQDREQLESYQRSKRRWEEREREIVVETAKRKAIERAARLLIEKQLAKPPQS